MIILDAIDKALEIVLGGAVTTNELPFVTSFADHIPATPAFTPAPQTGLTNGATPVVVMSSPVASVQRQLKFLSVYNADTVSQVVTVQYDDATIKRVILAFTLEVGYTLEYNDGVGFLVKDTTGRTGQLDPNLFARKAQPETITAGWTFTQEIDAQAGIDISGGALKIGGSTVIDASENADFGGTLAVGGTGTFGTGVGGATANIDGAAGTERQIAYRTAGLLRWIFRCNSAAESGGNAGSDFEVARRSDAGADLGVGMLIKRNTGNFGINIGVPTAQLHVLSGSASRVGLIVDTAASPTAECAVFCLNGVTQWAMDEISGGGRAFLMAAFDNDAGVGRRVQIGLNNDATTPAAGHLLVFDKGNSGQFFWPDDSAAEGVLRQSTSAPSNANNLAGVVVGTQTSWHELKRGIRPWDGSGAVRRIMAMPLFTFRFTGCGQRGNKLMHGVVIKARTRRSWFSMNYADNQTPAMDEAEIMGNLLAMAQIHERRIFELEEAV